MLLADDRPLLREGVEPVAAAQSGERVDVLDDAGLLVVSLFNEKAVVLNRRLVALNVWR